MNELLSKAGHVLVVEDDLALGKSVTNFFAEHNLPASSVAGRYDLYRHFTQADPSFVILGVGAGEGEALDILKEIRARSDIPIIVTSGRRHDEIDRVVCLELGADDYIAKPFGLRELLARVRAVLRRQELGRAARTTDPERGGYRFEDWRLHRRSRRLVDPSGNTVPLTKGEYALLVAFLMSPQRPLARERLLHATRLHSDIFDRSIDVQILRLRRKLEVDPANPRMILTERGVGYVFAPAVEPF